eukprot:2490248-Rhodomonas_salina.2
MEHLENVPPSLRLELRKPSVKGMGYRHNIPVSTIGEAADVDMSLEASDPLQVNHVLIQLVGIKIVPGEVFRPPIHSQPHARY